MSGQLNSSLFRREIVSIVHYEGHWSVLNKSRTRIHADITLSCGHTVRGVRSGLIREGQKTYYCPICCSEYKGKVATVQMEHKKNRAGVRYVYCRVRMLDGTSSGQSFVTDAEAQAWIVAGCPERVGKRKAYSRCNRPPTGLWEYHKPHSDKCCICGMALSESVPEDRPTGWDADGMRPKMQTWYYCRQCWQRHCKICGIKIEEVA